MPRHAVLVALAVALALPIGAEAQTSLPTDPPPNPREVVPDQRLENVDQRLLLAIDRLQATEAMQPDVTKAQAFDQAKQTLAETRDVFDDVVPQSGREEYVAAIDRAERAVDQRSMDQAVAALGELRQRILALAADPSPAAQ